MIPRRLAGDGWRDHAQNLALLCDAHHGRKTHLAEAALFRGDPYIWFRHLDSLRATGPVPAANQIGEAFKRLNELLEKP